MSRILNVSASDYRVKVQSGGTITLDVGVSPGKVVITGDLDVVGTTTTIQSTNTTIKDNILLLNAGQTGGGISGALNYRSGIEIDRGDYANAQLIFDESVNHYDPLTLSNIAGTFVLKTSDDVLSGIQVASLGTAGNDLTFDMGGTGFYKVRLVNAPGYEALVVNDNDIPNKKYVNDYVSATGGYANVDNFHYLPSPFQTRGQAYNNNIQFTVLSNLRAQITQYGLNVDNVNLYQNEVKTWSASGVNLKIFSDTTLSNSVRYVEVDDRVALTNQTKLVNADVDNSKTKLYTSATAGPGKTGLYFLNKRTGEPGQSIDETINDELVAKNRALLFSMLF